MILGGHCSGGIKKALENAHRFGMDAIQLFAQSPRTWRFPDHDPADLEAFKRRREELGIEAVTIHALYLLNLASPKDDFYEKSVTTLRSTVDTACAIEADAVVFHVGSHLGSGFEAGLGRVVPALLQCLDRCSETTWLCMEHAAGTGDTVGRSLDELAAIYEVAGPHCWRSRAPTATGRMPTRWRSYASCTRELRNPCEDPERRLADRQLVELGVDAPELFASALVARLDLDTAAGQRLTRRLDRTKTAARRLGRAEQVEVDVDIEHLLHAPDVRVPELLERVEERTALLETCAGVDDLVAVHSAAAAFGLVLRAQRELARPHRRMLARLHTRIVIAQRRPPQDLTSPADGGSARTYARRRRAMLSTSSCVKAW